MGVRFGRKLDGLAIFCEKLGRGDCEGVAVGIEFLFIGLKDVRACVLKFFVGAELTRA
jgi:hypothetical protein